MKTPEKTLYPFMKSFYDLTILSQLFPETQEDLIELFFNSQSLSLDSYTSPSKGVCHFANAFPEQKEELLCRIFENENMFRSIFADLYRGSEHPSGSFYHWGHRSPEFAQRERQEKLEFVFETFPKHRTIFQGRQLEEALNAAKTYLCIKNGIISPEGASSLPTRPPRPRITPAFFKAAISSLEPSIDKISYEKSDDRLAQHFAVAKYVYDHGGNEKDQCAAQRFAGPRL